MTNLYKFKWSPHLRKVKSQRYGWVIIDQTDRDWNSGKPLETKDLEEIVKNMRKNAFLC